MYSKFSIVEFSSCAVIAQQQQQQQHGEKVSNKKKSLDFQHMPKKRGRPAKSSQSSNNTSMFIKSTESIPVRYHPYIYVSTNKSNQASASPSSTPVNNNISSPPSTCATTHACNDVKFSTRNDSFKNRIVRTSISIRELLN